MKRKILFAILAIFVALAVTACDTEKPTDDDETPHTHTPGEAVTENFVDSTCTETGSYDEVFYCSGCGLELSRDEKSWLCSMHTIISTDFAAFAARCIRAKGSSTP